MKYQRFGNNILPITDIFSVSKDDGSYIIAFTNAAFSRVRADMTDDEFEQLAEALGIEKEDEVEAETIPVDDDFDQGKGIKPYNYDSDQKPS